MSLKVFLHTFLCAGLFWSAWCRIVHTTEHTRPTVRWAFSSLAMSSLLLGIAPWAYKLWPWYQRLTINWTELFILASFLAIQIVTAVHWKHGVPKDFHRKPKKPHEKDWL